MLHRRIDELRKRRDQLRLRHDSQP